MCQVIQQIQPIHHIWYFLLDHQYMVYLFINTSLLTNIHQALHILIISCNSGTVPVTLVRDLKRYGIVWLHPKYLSRRSIIYIASHTPAKEVNV